MSSYEIGYNAALNGRKRIPPEWIESPMAWKNGYDDGVKFGLYPY